MEFLITDVGKYSDFSIKLYNTKSQIPHTRLLLKFSAMCFFQLVSQDSVPTSRWVTYPVNSEFIGNQQHQVWTIFLLTKPSLVFIMDTLMERKVNTLGVLQWWRPIPARNCIAHLATVMIGWSCRCIKMMELSCWLLFIIHPLLNP